MHKALYCHLLSNFYHLVPAIFGPMCEKCWGISSFLLLSTWTTLLISHYKWALAQSSSCFFCLKMKSYSIYSHSANPTCSTMYPGSQSFQRWQSFWFIKALKVLTTNPRSHVNHMLILCHWERPVLVILYFVCWVISTFGII